MHLASIGTRQRVIAILLLAMIVRIGAMVFWQASLARDNETLRFGDSVSYWTMANHIARGLPYQYGSSESKIFRAPLYPIVLAPWTLLSDTGPSIWGVLGARLFGILLGVATVWIVMRSTQIIAGQTASYWAGLAACFYPGAVGMSVFVLSEAVSMPAITLSLALCLRIAHDRKVPLSNALTAGIALGLACLARPSWSLFPIFLVVYAILGPYRGMSASGSDRVEKGPSKTWFWLKSFCVYYAGVVLVMSPWWIRNYSITGKFVPTTLQVGASLYDGLHPHASGSSNENMDFVLPVIIKQKEEDALLAMQGKSLESTLEWRIDRRMKNAAIGWAIENPSDAISLGLIKLLKMWQPLPVAREVANPWVRWSEAIGYLGIVAASAIGMWASRKVPGAWLLVVPCIYLAVLHSIFIGSVRYRQPGVLLLCPLAGVGCQFVIEWIRAKVNGTVTNAQGHNSVA